MNQQNKRHNDSGVTLYAFMGKTLVVCPACSSCALSKQLNPDDESGWFAPRRLVCTQCAYTRTWAANRISRGWRQARDDYFELPLWLQVDCCGENLWAYNEEHIAFLVQTVSASLRERRKSAEYGWSNRSLVSRLPSWIKSRKNRAEVLKALTRLKEKLPSD